MEILYKKEKEEADQLLEQQRLVSSSDFSTFPLELDQTNCRASSQPNAAQSHDLNLSRARKSWFDRSPGFFA